MILMFIKNIAFALIAYKEFCPIEILDDPGSLGFIFVSGDEGG